MKTAKSEGDFNELTFYTLSHPDPSFIHQHVVDAQGAQTTNENTKPITLLFSLVGLYLYLERDFTGKEVQHFHTLMSRKKLKWPGIVLPEKRGEISVSDVLSRSPGLERDTMIRSWCKAVWDAYKENRTIIVNLVAHYERNR